MKSGTLPAIFFKTLHVKFPLWSIPVPPDFVMPGRLRPAALIFLFLILMVILLLYHAFWWTAAKLTECTKLQQENMMLTMEGKRCEELRFYLDETLKKKEAIMTKNI